MADAIEEVIDIQTISNGLNINIGTLNRRTVASMLLSAKRANELNHPVMLDAVGAGASNFRDDIIKTLLDNAHFSCIKGNISEIKALSNKNISSKGVDANILDKVNEENIDEVIKSTRVLAKETKSIVIITGEIDLIVSATKAWVVRNGCSMMGNITGSGCMLSSLMASFISANVDNIVDAAAAAVITMGIAGEKANEKMIKTESGNSSYRNYLIDEIFKFNATDLESRGRYELR
jgi:hydroxyethylthiazole kinase